MADLSTYINITANTVTTGNLSATGNVTSNSVVSTTGNVTGNFFIGNGSQLTGIAASYGNANVATFLAAYGSNTISTTGSITSGNITGGNVLTAGVVSATGNVTGNYILGNGALLTGVITSVANINSGTSNVTVVSSGGNVTVGVGGTSNVAVFATTGEYITGVVSASGNVTGGNVLTAGLISATGNITGGNISATNHTGTTVSVSGNVTSGNVLTGGIVSSTGNITGGNISATNHTGTAVSVTGNITAGNIINTGISSVTGNITGGNVLTAGQVSATGNITTANSFVGNLVGTTVSVTGNVSAGNVIINGQPTTYGVVNPAYMVVGLVSSITGFGLGSTFILDTIVGNTNSQVSYNSSTGVFTLTAGVTYDMSFTPSFITFSNTTAGFFCYDWVDATTNAQLDTTGIGTGTSISSQDTTAQQDNATARVIYTPNTNQTVKLRVTNALGTVTLRGGIGTQAIIKPLNPSIAVQATATGTVAATVVANTSPNSTTTTGGSSTSPALTVLTVAIPSAGTWRLDAELRVYVPGAGYMAAAFYDNGTLISGSEYFVAAGGVTQTGAATGQYGGFMSYNLTTTGATTVTLGFWSTTNSQFISSEDGRTWLRATQIDSIFALNTLATMSLTGNITTTGNVSATGNVTGGNVLTGGVISSTGNITGGNISATNHTGTTVSVTGNITGGNISATNHTGTTVSVTGNITGGNLLTGGLISAAGNITAANFFGNGNTLSNVATRFESSWTVPVGNSTQSFTVAASETYYLWVDCNIPNGILVWNATATVTNTNVPVVGAQYAWVYNGGGTPVDFTSIPNQFIGTANTIVRSNVAPSSTTNRFDFGINNTSGGNITVRYGWVVLS